MIILGDSTWRRADGKTSELQFLDGTRLIAVVHGNLIQNFDIQYGEIGTIVITVNLRSTGEVGFGSLPRKANIAFWVDLPETGRQRLGVGRIDYWRHDFDRDIQTVEIHARGSLASLIDQRCEKLFKGSLEDFIMHLTSGVPIRCEGLEHRQIQAYVNAPSIYGALRLMGISLGFVINEDSDGASVACRSNTRAIEDLRSKPLHEVGSDKVVSGTVEQGRPVKRRDG